MIFLNLSALQFIGIEHQGKGPLIHKRNLHIRAEYALFHALADSLPASSVEEIAVEPLRVLGLSGLHKGGAVSLSAVRIERKLRD